MKEIEAYTRGDEMNNNSYPSTILGLYANKGSVKDHEAAFRKYSYSQAEFNDRPFDLAARKRDSWSLNETIQKLYDLDSNISRKMFLDEYFNFMKKRGAVVTKIPVVAKLPLDLYRLYNAVQSFGGYAQVVKKRKWSRVVRDLGLPPSITSAAYTLRTQYLRLLYHFECEKNGVVANNLFFYEEQESIKQWSPGPMQRYEISPPSPKRFKDSDSEHHNNNNKIVDRNGEEDVIKNDEKEDADSQVTFVELSRDKREKSFEQHYNGDLDDDEDDVVLISSRSGSQTPPFMKRSRSEDVFRRESLDDEEVLNVRSASYDNILKKHSYDDSDEQSSRKRKYGEDESFNYRPNSNNKQESGALNENVRHIEDNASVKSTSPRPVSGETSSPSRRRFEDQRHSDRQRNDSSRQEETKNERTDVNYIDRENHHRMPRYAGTDLPNHRQLSRYEYPDHHHHSNSNDNYLSSPHRRGEVYSQAKVACQCNECYPTSTKQKRFQTTNSAETKHLGTVAGGGSFHQNLHSPSQIVPKNCLSPPYAMNGYERPHLKKQHEIEDQRLKRYNVYRGPPNRSQKLSTNPTEMTLKIKERTENAIVLSIVVDGVYYSGTLLTSLKR